ARGCVEPLVIARQVHPELRPEPLLAFHLDPSPEQVGDAPGDGEAEAVALVRAPVAGRRLLELTEELGHERLPDADPGIPDREYHLALGSLQEHRYAATVGE